MKNFNQLLIALFVLTTWQANAQYTKLLDFDGTPNGSTPSSTLISDGTFLYGTTSVGGANNLGTIFKIMPDGTSYTTLLDFDGTSNGSEPYNGSLASDGTFFYGMTSKGGTNNAGIIYKIKPDGTGYSKLLDFVGTNGSTPYGSLLYDGTFLYGITSSGGTSNQGTIFKIMPDGTGYAKLFDFDGISSGSLSLGGLISDGTFLYGTTYVGGANGLGTVFKIMPDGTGYLTLMDFDGTPNGASPFSDLMYDGTFLYGTTDMGGTNNKGIVFKIMPDGTGYSTLFNFAGISNGSNPESTLISDGTFLYGLTAGGGANNNGTIFKIMPDGTGFSKLLDFDGVLSGKNSTSSLVAVGTYFYGMTTAGGTSNLGTVFKFMECSPNTGTDVQTACDSYLWIDGNTYTSNNNTATFTLPNAAGCDSVVTLDLTINNSDTGTDVQTACDSYLWIDGNTYTSNNNTATFTLPNAAGCDSVVTLDLTITTVDVTVTNTSPTLIANQTSATYQWLDCNNANAPISGETAQSFTATANGDYAVAITLGSCTDTSACENITGVGVKEITNNIVSIYPNPTDGKIIISLGSSITETMYSITSIEGKVVATGKTTSKMITVDLTNKSKGVYFIKINSEQGTSVHQLIRD